MTHTDTSPIPRIWPTTGGLRSFNEQASPLLRWFEEGVRLNSPRDDDAYVKSGVRRVLLPLAAGVRAGATAGVIFHGDRGSQYLSDDYRTLVGDLGMVQSVGRTGVCWDNSVAESLWSSLKRELVHR